METLDLRRNFGKKPLSRIGFALAIYFITGNALQILTSVLWARFFPDDAAGNWLYAALILSQYAIALPVGVALLLPLPMDSLPRLRITAKQFFVTFLIGYCLLFAGNLIGLQVTTIIDLFKGAPALPAANPVTAIPWWARISMLVVLAPIFEEYVFRKLLIERLARYGEWVAAFTSALAFGLFHGNFQQVFYAFGIGLVFGYVFVKTGKVWYTMVLHAMVNGISGVLGSLALESGSLGSMVLLALPLWGCAIAGLVLLIKNRKRIFFFPRVSYLLPQKGWRKVVFANPGWVCFFVVCAAMFGLSVVG